MKKKDFGEHNFLKAFDLNTDVIYFQQFLWPFLLNATFGLGVTPSENVTGVVRTSLVRVLVVYSDIMFSSQNYVLNCAYQLVNALSQLLIFYN